MQSNSGNRLGNTEAGDGARYAGRGYVQLVGRVNYARVGKALGIHLEGNPDLMLENDTATKVLIGAALDGILTGRNLTQYFSTGTQHWVNARRVFNGNDRAAQIANRALQYSQALAGTGLPSAR